MKISLLSVSSIATLALAASFLCVERPSPAQPVAPTPRAEGTKLLGRLPVAFVPNLGQWDSPARYVARIGAMTMFLEEKGWSFTLVERTAAKGKDKASETQAARGVAVRMTFAGAGTPALVAEERLPGLHNYFLGNDPSKWRSDVPLYASVRYRDVQPGVDVRAREYDGHFEYDLLLAPGADLDAVEVVVEGSEGMYVDREGALVMQTALGPVRMPVPLSWEEGRSGAKSLVTCQYTLRGADRFGFEVPGRQPGWALVVDPGLVWSTFLGGSDLDEGRAVVVDGSGAVTTAGYVYSTNFPVTPGAFDQTYNGGNDAFVARLAPSGSTLLWATYLGGSAEDAAFALVLDPSGDTLVAGSTRSTNFPTTLGAYDTTHNGGTDAFVARLNATGSALAWSTLLGGSGNEDYPRLGLHLEPTGTVALSGGTDSANFPTTPGAHDTSYNGGGDAFVSRLAADGSSLLFSTFLGGTGSDYAPKVGTDPNGLLTVAGYTGSADFPVTPGAYDTSFNGAEDAFVTRLNASGGGLTFSTFLGGSGREFSHDLGMVVDSTGAVTVAGGTGSSDFPTTLGAFDTTPNGQSDLFVTRLDPTGTTLLWSTLVGGSQDDQVQDLEVDATGAAVVTGETTSTGYPTTLGAYDPTANGFLDVFVTKIHPSGGSLAYSTFLGSNAWDASQDLALASDGSAVIGGYTKSGLFPTTPGAFQTAYQGGGSDPFVTRLDMLPTGVSAFGRSSPGCTGPLAISVTSMPQVGNANFALTCGNAPPTTSGLLALTGNGFASPVVVLGAEVWVDPTLVFIQLPANSNSVGASEVTLPIPNGRWLRGTRLFAQFFWAGPSSPPPCPPLGLSASNALEFTIQP